MAQPDSHLISLGTGRGLLLFFISSGLATGLHGFKAVLFFQEERDMKACTRGLHILKNPSESGKSCQSPLLRAFIGFIRASLVLLGSRVVADSRNSP